MLPGAEREPLLLREDWRLLWRRRLKTLAHWALVLALLAITGCDLFQRPLAPTGEVVDPDINPPLPGPGNWPAFHGDNANHGASFVATGFALEPKWSVGVGPVLYSSPVIGGNGRIVLGDMNGRLHAINRFGTVAWRLDFTPVMGAPPAMINASPAVSENGAIYVVTTEAVGDEVYRSTLHLVTADGRILRSTTLPDGGYTTAAPKLWRFDGEDHVFLYVRRGFDKSALMVFDKFAQLVAREDMDCVTPVEGSSSIWDALGEFFDLVHDAFFDGDLGIDFDTSVVIPPLSERFGWLDPTVAIVDEPGLVERGHAHVVVVDKACFIKAFEWQKPTLTELWSERHDFRFQSSPTVVEAARTIILAGKDGRVRGHDLVTGEEKWQTDLKSGPIMSTPATLGGSIVYVVTEELLATLDAADGSVLRRRAGNGRTVASPVLSGSHLFVSTIDGLATYSFDFLDQTSVHQGRGGLATPALGSDGTLYAVTATAGEERFLRAYGGLDFTLPDAPDRPGVLGR